MRASVHYGRPRRRTRSSHRGPTGDKALRNRFLFEPPSHFKRPVPSGIGQSSCRLPSAGVDLRLTKRWRVVPCSYLGRDGRNLSFQPIDEHRTEATFMLINDSVTVAVEVPVFLTQEDIRYYRSCGFDVDFESDVITGHIDFLQIRNGHIHILDYKPDARKETHAHVQLTIYALAL